MIEIAGGIILALFILALLPWIFVGISWAIGIALLLAVAGGAVWLIWTGTQSAEGLAGELVGCGVFLIWLAYEIRTRREMKADRQAKLSGLQGSAGHRIFISRVMRTVRAR